MVQTKDGTEPVRMKCKETFVGASGGDLVLFLGLDGKARAARGFVQRECSSLMKWPLEKG